MVFTLELRAVETTTALARAIPWDQLGVEAQKQCPGEGIAITPTAEGALLRSSFQKLEAEVKGDGLWLSSTATAAGRSERFRVLATALGRPATAPRLLPATGTVMVTAEAASFARPGLLEEYRVSADGVRQDFVVLQRPEGMGELRVTLGVTGARVDQADYGIKLTLPNSGREIGYSKLHVTDANGRALSARLEGVGTDRIMVCVEDAGATYPVRIDPTFSDSDWVSMNPGILGTDGTVYAMIMDGSSNLYVGGTFATAGAASASNIAKWDGVKWSALGSGVDGAVTALAVNGTDVYAGGSFIKAGGVTANRVAKWNGTAWSALGTGVDDSVSALALVGSTLYAAGAFSTAGGVPASYIAQWNGSAWSALGSGVSGNINALAVMGTDLYAGGTIRTAGGVSVNRIAKWDGSAWSALGGGLGIRNGVVNTLAVSGTMLYAGGAFLYNPFDPREVQYNVAKWDGSTWTLLETGSENEVQAMVASGTNVYAAGLSSLLGDMPSVSKWDGSTWSTVGIQTTWYGALAIYALEVNGTDLFVGGSVLQGYGYPFSNNVVKWNGEALSQLYAGINGTVRALAVGGSYLYAGGAFTAAGGVEAKGIARWNGSIWTALGSGVNGTVTAILVNGTDVYVGGFFTTAGGVAANGIARWDGTAWSALGQGMSGAGGGTVNALAMIGTDLYAGGHFGAADGITANNIAKWDGSAWSALDGGLGGDFAEVFALAVAGTDLYVGGYFSTAGAVSVSNVAKWNGSAWSALGSGYPNIVYSLAVSGSRLYVGGSSIGIWVWDGSSFSSYIWVPFYPIYALLVSGTNLYVGGKYSDYMRGIAKWNGSTLSGLGSGVSAGYPIYSTPTIEALATDSNNHLFVGGSNFTTVGFNTVSPNLVQANLPTPTPDIAVTQSAALSDGTGGVDFGPVVAGSGSAALTFTLTNPGDAEISGLSVSIDGANNADFAAGALSDTHFVPGESVTFNVTYAPGALTAGSSAGLHIVSNVGGSKSPFDISLSGMGVTANQGWQQQYFGVITGAGNAAPGADPNHNGIPNLMEYALGGDPAGVSSGSGVLPGAGVDAAGNRLQLSFNRYPSRNDITLIVQAADSLAGPWTDLAQSANGAAFSVITPGASILESAMGSPRAVSVSDLYQTTDPAHPRRFMRLRVSQ